MPKSWSLQAAIAAWRSSLDLLITRTWAPWICVWAFGTACRTNFEISLAFSSEMPVTSFTVWRTQPLAARSAPARRRALGGRLDRARLQRLERKLPADRLLLEHLIGRLQPIFGSRGHLDRLVLQLERGVRVLEVEALVDLAAGLVDRVADLLHVDLGDDVEAGLGGHGRRIP